MTLRRYDESSGAFEQGQYQGQMPVFRYDSASGRWLDALLTDGLVTYLHGSPSFVSGSTVLDASGNKNDGTMNGGIGVGADGVLGDVFSLDGVDDDIDGIGTQADGNAFSVSLWGLFDSTENYQVAWGNKATQAFIEFRRDGSKGIAWAMEDANTNHHILNSGVVANTGEWNHAVGVYDGAEMRLYVNGTIEATASESDGLNIPTEWFLGSYDGSSHFHSGKLADLRTYNRALSTAEITALYKQGLSP